MNTTAGTSPTIRRLAALTGLTLAGTAIPLAPLADAQVEREAAPTKTVTKTATRTVIEAQTELAETKVKLASANERLVAATSTLKTAQADLSTAETELVAVRAQK